MKKETQILIFVIFATINFANGQWYTTGNNLSGTEYLGGDNTSNQPLRLKTLQPYSIDFYINNSTSPTMSHTTNGDLDITTSNRGYLINGQ